MERYQSSKPMKFKQWLESIYYHGTTPENAESILKNGIDPDRYKSGMFRGFYLTPNPTYFNGFSGPKKTILAIEIDDSQILDVESVKDEDLLPIDPHFKMMSPMYKNTMIMKLALEKGYSGVKNGKEVVLFTDRAIRSIRPINSSHSK